ncbi:MAG: hypothetical protein KDA32_14875, partial [Phycisphaerales bacterium]|nr:hypothetical protein [Phycisphaerales bacterium]
MTDRLSLYNGALTVHLGQPPLSALTDDESVRYALDNVWDRGALKTCLQKGQWNFAARSQRLEYDPSVTPDFGYQYAFAKPTDIVRLMGLCSDEYFEAPLRMYQEESGYWFTDLQQIYVRYVSNDASYGLDYSLWPENFTRFVEAFLADQIANLSTFSDKKTDTAAA